MTAFDSWESELYHHGIPGQVWGVRKYQNEDGSLTAAGRDRYGYGSDKNISARKLQRDFNRLEKGNANVIARKHFSSIQKAKYAKKAIKKGLKIGSSEFNNSKIGAKYKKAEEQEKLHTQQLKSTHDLQRAILKKAAQNSYTLANKEVLRLGKTGSAKVMSLLSGNWGKATISNNKVLDPIASRRKRVSLVKSNKVKIRKHGSGYQDKIKFSNN